MAKPTCKNFRELDAKGVDELATVPVAELRNLYRVYRELAYSISAEEFENQVKARKPSSPVAFIVAARKVRVECDQCRGSGVYAWGAVINGVPTNTGMCFRCRGKGTQHLGDMRRNKYYDNHARRCI